MSELKATHQCTICGARWRQLDDFRWNLRSKECGPCCDNIPMGDQIEALEDVAPWSGPLTAEEQGMIDDAWQTHKCAAMDALIADSADLYDAPASADAPEVDNQIAKATENYTRGLRDLSAMPHVTAEIGGVLRDCADWIDQAAALSAMSPAWQDIASAPPACCVLAAYFDHEAGESIMSVEFSPPQLPFTHWQLLPEGLAK